jgi:hypothetical protein
MMNAVRVVTIGAVLIGLSACNRTYDDQVRELVAYVRHERIGTTASVWLVKDHLGLEDRVALFFAYIDNAAACGDMVQLYRQNFPADTYICEFAN